MHGGGRTRGRSRRRTWGGRRIHVAPALADVHLAGRGAGSLRVWLPRSLRGVSLEMFFGRLKLCGYIALVLGGALVQAHLEGLDDRVSGGLAGMERLHPETLLLSRGSKAVDRREHPRLGVLGTGHGGCIQVR